MLRTYYELAKPGIVRGNAMVAAGGYLFAAGNDFNFWQFMAMLVGISLIMASACVVNNCIDRDIDSKMARTKKRALVTGKVTNTQAIIYAALLGAGGVASLIYTNPLTLNVALAGFFLYVVAYGIWKRRSPIGTIVGSLSGATPPVVGYVAFTNQLDLGAGLLFLIIVLWQMPHFYAIAIYRANEYRAAKIPVLPLVHGVEATKMHIIGYIAAYCITVVLLALSGYAGLTYLVVMTGLSVFWLTRGLLGLRDTDSSAWARRMFGISLIVMIGFSIMIAANAWLP